MKSAALIFILAFGFAAVSCDDGDSSSTPNRTGRPGSLARFALTSTHLYTVGDEALTVYQILGDGGLSKVDSVYIFGGIETIAAVDDLLYLGTPQAMFIYDITIRSRPTLLSSYAHFVGCDPVVVQDTLAYFTVRTNNCRINTFNTMSIVNIKDPTQPLLVSTYGMQSPYGLGIDGNLLFVCEGDYGLKVIDVSDPFAPVQRESYPYVHAYDVIPNDGVLVMTGDDGVFQYDYTGESSLKILSTIPIE